MSKREAVPKHSLPPQKQILSYMGRFINCPYAPDTDGTEVFCIAAAEHSQRTAEKEPPSGGLPDGGFDIPALRR